MDDNIYVACRNLSEVVNRMDRENRELRELVARQKEQLFRYLQKQSGVLFLEDIHMTTRLEGCLRSLGVHTLADVSKFTEDELLKTKMMGKKSLAELKVLMRKHGLAWGRLPTDPPEWRKASAHTITPKEPRRG